MPYAEPTLVVASAARTTSGNSGVINPSGDGETINFNVRVTAASGTSPSLALSVEWSNDATNFAVPETADTFTAITTTVERVKTFERKAKFYRLVWTITGTTPSFTFQIYEYVSA
jgi:hypothetical protein